MSEFDYAALVRKQWGKEWNKKDTAYEFSNGRKFDQTDAYYTNYAVYNKSQIAALLPVAWYQYGVGISFSDGFVDAWADQSVNGRHLLPITPANRPSLSQDNSLLFNGANQYLKTAAFTLNQPETVYILGRQVTWTTNDRFCDGNAASSGSIRQGAGGAGSSPQIAITAGSNVATNSGLVLNTYGVICAIFNGASSSLQINNGAATTGNAGAENMGGFTLGATGAGASFGNVQIKEVIIFSSAHDADTRTAVSRYLSAVE
jgi:hypothetical protein